MTVSWRHAWRVDTDELRDRWRGVAAWLDATPGEMAGLAVLLLGVVGVVGLTWWSGRPVPAPVELSPAVSDDGGAASVGAPTGQDTVVVHVAGAVARPGVVEVAADARVVDVLMAAGGTVLDADVSDLNLARVVTDGERLDVPRLGDATVGPRSAADGADGGGALRPDGTLDLNRATAEDFEGLPGIGPVLAERIVAWRDANGSFREVGQLREVAGIGEKTFQQLAPLVGV